MHMLLIW